MPGKLKTALTLERVVFASLLLLLVTAAFTIGTMGAAGETALEFAIFLLAAAWVVEGQRRGPWLVRQHRYLIPLLLLAAFGYFQSVVLWNSSLMPELGIRFGQTLSASPDETQAAARKLFAVTLWGGLLLRYVSSRFRLQLLISVVVVLGVIIALVEIARQLFASPLSSNAFGQFSNVNHLAFMMEMVLGLLLGMLLLDWKGRSISMLYIGLALPVWIALILTNSRGAVLSMAGQFLFLAALLVTRPRKSQRPRQSQLIRFRTAIHIGIAAVLLVAIGVGTLWVGGEPMMRRLRSVPGELQTAGGDGASRLEIWRATLGLIKANPVVGVGLGAYRVAITRHHDASGEWIPPAAHNEYLEIAAGGGLIAVFLITWFAAGVIRAAWSKLKLPSAFQRSTTAGALVGLFGVTVHNLVDFGLRSPVNALLFGCLIAIAIVDAEFETA